MRINMPGFYSTHVALAAVYAQLGRDEEAAAAVQRLQEVYPGLTVQNWVQQMRLWNQQDSMIARMTDGLRKAGLEEGGS